MRLAEVNFILQRLNYKREVIKTLIVQFLNVGIKYIKLDGLAAALLELLYEQLANEDQPSHQSQLFHLACGCRLIHKRKLSPLALWTVLFFTQICITAEFPVLLHLARVVDEVDVALGPAVPDVLFLLSD